MGYSKLLVDCCQSCAELATYVTDAVKVTLQIMDEVFKSDTLDNMLRHHT